MLITEFKAYSHNGTDWTEAFAKAVEALRQTGGGELTVPAGEYPSGSIQLTSHMILHLEAGALIRYIPDETLYPAVDLEFEGIGSLCHRPCLYARDCEDITVTGEGGLNGSGSYWWDKHRSHTLTMPRPYLVCFDRCEHVVLENISLMDSPVWTVHPLRCHDVIISGLRIKNPWDSPNTDGIDPDCCSDMLIRDCEIDVGDDCIAIKSGTEDTVNPLPSCRITITGCRFIHGHGGVVLGSEMSGGVRDIRVNNCIFRNTDRGIRLKTRRGRGGAVEGISLSHLDMEGIMCPFVFNMFYFCGKNGRTPFVADKAPHPVDAGTPALRGVEITDVEVRKCSACAAYFFGLPEQHVEGVTFSNVSVTMDPEGKPDKPAMMDGCEAVRGKGIFMRNADGVRFDRVTVNGVEGPLWDTDDSVTLVQ